MKLQQKSKWITVLAISIIAMLFVTSSPQKVAADDLAILSVSHNPTSVSQNTVVTVEIAFNDDTNVSGVQIQYCALEPEFVCHFPKIAMTSEAANVWNGSFTVTEASGLIGYELYISLENGTTIVAPDSTDYLGYDNIYEPSTDVFYFSIDLISASPTASAPLSFGLCELAISFSIIIFVRSIVIKRRKNV